MPKKENSKIIKRIPYDGLFKNLLKEPILLKDFLMFAGREDIVNIIDFSKGIQPLDTDNNNIYVITESNNKRYADVILLVSTLIDGKEGQLILHFEPQSFPDKEFPMRMYTYNKRIEVNYEKDVCSFALCFKDYPVTSPNSYTKAGYGLQKNTFEFNQIHLKDRKYSSELYMESENLVEIAICGLMNRGDISNLELYLKCLTQLDIINKKGFIWERKDIIFKIILSCLHHFIKLDTRKEKEIIRKKIEEITEGEEKLMELMTLIHEEAKIDSILKYVNKKLKKLENNEGEKYLEFLQGFLENSEEIELEKLEDEFFECDSFQEIITKIETMKTVTETTI